MPIRRWQPARSSWLRRVGRWLARYQPDLVAALGLTALGLAGTAALLGWFETSCRARPFACGFLQSMVVTGAVAALGYYALLGAKRTRCLRRYRATFRDRTARRTGLTDPRDQQVLPSQARLVADLRYTLAHDPAETPVLLVGDAGSGKSRLLLALGQALLAQGELPVLVTARQLTDRTLPEAARDNFVAAVAPQLRTRDEGEAVFRQLARGIDIVVMVDNLADVEPHLPTAQRDARLADLLAQAREAGFRLVLGSRPSSVPEGLEVSTYQLPPLEPEEAASVLAEALGTRAGELDATTVPAIARTPFFLGLLADRLRDGHPPPAAGNPAAWRDELVADWVDDHLERGRERALRERGTSRAREPAAGGLLPDIAYALLVNHVGSMGRQELVTALQSLPHHRRGLLAHRVLGALQRATATRLVEFVPEVNHYRFRHTVLQSELAGLAIATQPPLLDHLLVAGFGPAEKTAVAACLRAVRDPRTGLALATRLTDAVEDAAASGADLLPRLCTAVVQGCRGAGPDPPTTQALLRLAIDHFPTDAPTAERLGFVAALGTITPDTAAGTRGDPTPTAAPAGASAQHATAPARHALWRFAEDPAPSVQWAAVQHLAGRAHHATTADHEHLEALLAGATHDTDDRPALGPWLLPIFEETAAAPARPRLTGLLTHLVARALDAAAGETGTAMALARGFTLAATLEASRPPHPLAVTLLAGRPAAWYARLRLVHAVGIRATGAADPDRATALDTIAGLAVDDPHPLVRRTAALTLAACRERRAWPTFAWGDEAEVMRQPPDALQDEVLQVLGDVALLLSLISCATRAGGRPEQQRAWAEATRLPVCLATSPQRHELEDGCSADCGVGLCPYPPAACRREARGEISLAFVRRQREVAAQLGRPPWSPRGPSLDRVWTRLAPTISRPPTGAGPTMDTSDRT